MAEINESEKKAALKEYAEATDKAAVIQKFPWLFVIVNPPEQKK